MNIIFQARTDPCHCPYCGSINDGVTMVDSIDLPKPGDCSVCGYCGEIATFDFDASGQLITRLPTSSEQLMFTLDPQVQFMVTTVKEKRS